MNVYSDLDSTQPSLTIAPPTTKVTDGPPVVAPAIVTSIITPAAMSPTSNVTSTVPTMPHLVTPKLPSRTVC